MRSKKSVLVLPLLLLFASMTGACQRDSERKTDAVSPHEEAFMNEIFFAGSSTLAPTISQLADSFTNKYRTWDKVDSSMPPEEIQISVSTGGSGAGARAVLDRTANFGMLARAARETEREALAHYQEATIGIDALLIAVPTSSSLAENRTNIKKEEVQRIFSGKISLWSELDSHLPGEEIVLLVRDVGGGAHGVFQRAIMDTIDVSERAVQVPSMSGLVNRLVDNRRAIGYASYGVAREHRDDLVPFTLDGIEPSPENIVSGSYPIARPLVLVWDGDLSAPEQVFLDYLMSEEGTAVISGMGFLPVH